MAGGFGPVAAGRHIAPSPLTPARLVEEDPAARVVRADPDAIGATGPDLVNERIGQPGQGVVERIADVTMPDGHAVGRADEFDPLPRSDRAIDFREGIHFGRPAVAHGVGDITQGRPHGAHASQGRGVVDA